MTIDYVKSSDNVSDLLTKGQVREAVERSSMGCVYGLGKVCMSVTLSSRLEIPRARSKEKKVWLTVRHCKLTQSILMMKTIIRNEVKTLRLVNEVIKLIVFNNLQCLIDLTK